MKLKILLILLAFTFALNVANANPIIQSTINGRQYTSTVLVYSDDEIDAYIPEDMINFNLFYTKYPDNGNFSFNTYIVFKDPYACKEMSNKISAGITSGTISTLTKPYPELFSSVEIQFYCDNQTGNIKFGGETYLDQDGDLIGDLITSRHPNSIIENYSQMINNIAYGCSVLLDKYKNYPKNSNIIKRMRQN